MVINEEIEQMKLNGNVLCLDFLNTIYHRFKTPLESYLKNFGDLLCWGKRVGVLSEDQYGVLAKRAAENPTEAEAFFASEAMEIRALLDRIFYPIAQREEVSAQDMEAFNRQVSFYLAHAQVQPLTGGYGFGWSWPENSYFWITAPVIKTAYDFLMSDQLRRIGSCPKCGWLFLDVTKNGKRRWCSMEDCGSAAKAKDYYHRHREA
jgi:predicted RNA-binding Zn ribbon-like protein